VPKARRKPENQQLICALGAHTSWANTVDRTARTATPRAAFEATFVRDAGGDPTKPLGEQPLQVRQRAASLRKAYYKRLALLSAQSRARRKPPEK